MVGVTVAHRASAGQRLEAPPADGTPQGATRVPDGDRGQRQNQPQSNRSGAQNAGNGRNPGWMWWRDESIKKEIGLTTEQAARIDGLFEQRMHDVEPFFAEYRKQQQALDKMLKEATASDTDVLVQIGRMQTPWLKVNESRTMMLYRISRVLNPDQYKKLQALQDRGRRGGGPH